MSHVATIDLEVKDLAALAEAARRLGGEWREGQATYKWWGRHMGDYPIPEGFTENDLGKCQHAIHFPDAAYEVGVVRRRDGRPGWQMLWDFVDGRLSRLMGGKDANLLKREYAAVVARKTAMQSGFVVSESRQADGSLVLTCSR